MNGFFFMSSLLFFLFNSIWMQINLFLRYVFHSYCAFCVLFIQSVAFNSFTFNRFATLDFFSSCHMESLLFGMWYASLRQSVSHQFTQCIYKRKQFSGVILFNATLVNMFSLPTEKKAQRKRYAKQRSTDKENWRKLFSIWFYLTGLAIFSNEWAKQRS